MKGKAIYQKTNNDKKNTAKVAVPSVPNTPPPPAKKTTENKEK